MQVGSKPITSAPWCWARAYQLVSLKKAHGNHAQLTSPSITR
uniref:Uncharacterized protein n=1 Tax=Setaria italica TaxID=4555 RepID=K4AI20_SETIT